MIYQTVQNYLNAIKACTTIEAASSENTFLILHAFLIWAYTDGQTFLTSESIDKVLSNTTPNGACVSDSFNQV